MIDTSKGLLASDFAAFEMSDVILVVVAARLMLPAQHVAPDRAFSASSNGLADRVKLIVNRSGSLESEISLKKAEETLKMPVSWQIPNASKAFQAGADQRGAARRRRQGAAGPTRCSWRSPGRLRPAADEPLEAPPKGLFAAFF